MMPLPYGSEDAARGGGAPGMRVPGRRNAARPPRRHRQLDPELDALEIVARYTREDG
jgi:hypothetical protein